MVFEMLEIILGFIFGVFASWVFWRYLLFLKPKLEVPTSIKEIINKDGNKEYIYRTKNLGKRQVVDISIKATICELTNIDPDHPLSLVHKLKIDLDNADVLCYKNKRNDPWGLPNYRGFHIQQIDENTNESINILQLLSNKKRRLIITLRSSDSISRTTVITRHTYTQDNIEIYNKL